MPGTWSYCFVYCIHAVLCYSQGFNKLKMPHCGFTTRQRQHYLRWLTLMPRAPMAPEAPTGPLSPWDPVAPWGPLAPALPSLPCKINQAMHQTVKVCCEYFFSIPVHFVPINCCPTSPHIAPGSNELTISIQFNSILFIMNIIKIIFLFCTNIKPLKIFHKIICNILKTKQENHSIWHTIYIYRGHIWGTPKVENNQKYIKFFHRTTILTLLTSSDINGPGGEFSFDFFEIEAYNRNIFKTSY